MKKNKYSGSSFDDFLKEEGIYEEVKTLAQKELAAAGYKRYPIVLYSPARSNGFSSGLTKPLNLSDRGTQFCLESEQ